MGARGNVSNAAKLFVESMRRFCRSIELCDGYLRGYYGLKLVSRCGARNSKECTYDATQVTDRLSKMISKDPKAWANSSATAENDELPIPSERSVNALHEKATSALAQIVKMAAIGQYNEAEIKIAKALLDKSAQSITR